MAGEKFVSCPDHTLYAMEGLVHEVQILGPDGKSQKG